MLRLTFHYYVIGIPICSESFDFKRTSKRIVGAKGRFFQAVSIHAIRENCKPLNEKNSTEITLLKKFQINKKYQFKIDCHTFVGLVKGVVQGEEDFLRDKFLEIEIVKDRLYFYDSVDHFEQEVIHLEIIKEV